GAATELAAPLRFFRVVEYAMPLKVRTSLDFACCVCEQPVYVALECEGPGLFARDPKAAVRVPCPACEKVNEVIFDPNGVVYAVAPYRSCLQANAPSLN